MSCLFCLREDNLSSNSREPPKASWNLEPYKDQDYSAILWLSPQNNSHLALEKVWQKMLMQGEVSDKRPPLPGLTSIHCWNALIGRGLWRRTMLSFDWLPSLLCVRKIELSSLFPQPIRFLCSVRFKSAVIGPVCFEFHWNKYDRLKHSRGSCW